MSNELSGAEATKLMRAMGQDQKEAAIYASPNVIGYDRFVQTAKQVALREAYRKPKPSSGDDGPKVG